MQAAFFLRVGASFAAVVLLVAWALPESVQSPALRVALGAGVAALLLGVVTHQFVGRGRPAGRSLVSRPRFVPQLSHAGRDHRGATVGSHLPGGGSGIPAAEQ